MADQPTQTELNHAREVREERRADFWQRCMRPSLIWRWRGLLIGSGLLLGGH